MRPTEPRSARAVLVLLAAPLVPAALALGARGAMGLPGPLRAPASAAAGAAAMLILGSFGEWLVHRFAMHRGRRFPLFRIATELHHRAHHRVHFPPDRYLHAGPVEYPSVFGGGSAALARTRAGRIATVSSHAGFYALFAAPMVALALRATGNGWFAASMAATAALLIGLFVRVHDAVHYPGASRLERFRWFRFLDRHHYIHHVDNGANCNFLLPLGDLLLGTLRLELRPEETARWPSWEEARRRLWRPAQR